MEKVHAVVAQSTCPSASQNVQSTSCSDHFWKLRCRKNARRCGAKHISKSKVQKTEGYGYGALLDVQMSFRVAGARDCAPSQRGQNVRVFVAVSETMAGVGHMQRICKDAFRVAGAVQETCSSELLGGPGVDFLRWVGCILEQIFSFGGVILRDRCSTSHDLASLFRGRRSTLDRWNGKIAKRTGTRPPALH